MAGAVSVPAAFKWLTPFECLRRLNAFGVSDASMFCC